MPIVFDEISAEIAPPAGGTEAGAGSAPTAPPGDAPDPLEQVRRALTLLREREARSLAD